MSDMEHLISLTAAQIAMECAAEFSRQTRPETEEEFPDVNCYDFGKVLRARILPLLEAGEACRRRLDYAYSLPRDIQAREIYDGAKSKAMGA